MVNLHLTFNSFTPSATGWVYPASIPEGYRPASIQDLIVVDNRTSTGETKTLLIRIYPTGEMSVWIPTIRLVQPYISATYIS